RPRHMRTGSVAAPKPSRAARYRERLRRRHARRAPHRVRPARCDARPKFETSLSQLAQRVAIAAHDVAHDFHLARELGIAASQRHAVRRFADAEFVALANTQFCQHVLRQNDAQGVADLADLEGAAGRLRGGLGRFEGSAFGVGDAGFSGFVGHGERNLSYNACYNKPVARPFSCVGRVVMTALTYPQELKPLTSLRFIAALWVLLYHFKDHLGLGMGQFGLVADGYLGVDLFFTLSGFILAHVYLTSLEGGRFGYGGFLKNRIARVYPMHLAALGAMLVLFAGASILGVGESNPDAFRLSDLPAHLLMVHAWGTTPTVGWNFPSWSISAEWLAYLLFPLVAGVVLEAKRWSGAFAVGAIALCLFSFWALDNLSAVFPGVGQNFSQMTAQIGALRILPSFLLGVALYAFGREHAAPKSWAWPIVAACAD